MFKFVLVICCLVAAMRLCGSLRIMDDTEVLPFADADLVDSGEHSGELVNTLVEDEHEDFCEWHHCDKVLREKKGLRGFLDLGFLRKFVRNLIPFGRKVLQMRFFLFKRGFPDCGQELDVNDPQTFRNSGLDPNHPTRIIIHGWMSQSRGSFNRDVKNAYLSRGDFNVIVADWSANAATLNYFYVVRMIEAFGGQVAHFTQLLNDVSRVRFDDIYLIGHSLGAQIAGAAGKFVKPQQYNTIFALDPAGPKFRHRSIEFRIDPTDAKYVESIQTSANLGFLEPTGNATFYPNYGVIQKNCYYVGCSHIRAYKMFAESITSKAGFWGLPCRIDKRHWQCDRSQKPSYPMGGEPSTPSSGTFYVKTAASEPFALGRT